MRNQPKEHTEKSFPKTQTTIQNYRNQIAQISPQTQDLWDQKRKNTKNKNSNTQTHGQTTINTQKDRKKEEEEEDEERQSRETYHEFSQVHRLS